MGEELKKVEEGAKPDESVKTLEEALALEKSKNARSACSRQPEKASPKSSLPLPRFLPASALPPLVPAPPLCLSASALNYHPCPCRSPPVSALRPHSSIPEC